MDAPVDTTQAHCLNHFCQLLLTALQSFVLPREAHARLAK
jgi:hypothetical protein